MTKHAEITSRDANAEHEGVLVTITCCFDVIFHSINSSLGRKTFYISCRTEILGKALMSSNE